jgi:hypothetical protein
LNNIIDSLPIWANWMLLLVIMIANFSFFIFWFKNLIAELRRQYQEKQAEKKAKKLGLVMNPILKEAPAINLDQEMQPIKNAGSDSGDASSRTKLSESLTPTYGMSGHTSGIDYGQPAENVVKNPLLTKNKAPSVGIGRPVRNRRGLAGQMKINVAKVLPVPEHIVPEATEDDKLKLSDVAPDLSLRKQSSDFSLLNKKEEIDEINIE